MAFFSGLSSMEDVRRQTQANFDEMQTGAARVNASASMYNTLQQIAEQRRQFDEQQAAQRASAQQAAGGMKSLVDEYNRAYAEAKYGNEQRYQQMLGAVDSTSGQQSADIRTDYGNQAATGMQNLQRLGMSNLTVAPTMQLGVQREQSAALNRLADQMLQTKLGVINGYKTEKDWAPSNALLLAALQAGQAASGAYGGVLSGALGGISTAPSAGGGVMYPGGNVNGKLPGVFSAIANAGGGVMLPGGGSGVPGTPGGPSLGIAGLAGVMYPGGNVNGKLPGSGSGLPGTPGGPPLVAGMAYPGGNVNGKLPGVS